ncbi:MAG: hypothetical protein ACK42C_03905 [Aquificaceae bacterium]|uniref:hypothetical protein n=1 Tax=Hydrogenobacter sp. Uz 6-8 TaxID=3384828 RepID=UPI000F259392|nr:MAG: hypothetical protein D6804_06040 [Aquificota bacterium]
MRYIWEKERINIEGKFAGHFVPLSVIDTPVELVSTDGSLYLLWVKSLEEGEHWFLLELEPELTAEYLRGVKPLKELFNRGVLWLCERRYDTYETVRVLEKGNGGYKVPPGDIYLPRPDSSEEALRVYKKFVKMFDRNFRKLIELDEFYTFRRAYTDSIKSEPKIVTEYDYTPIYLTERELLYAA